MAKPEEYRSAVYYTQGGGLARLSGQSGDTYIFVEAPRPEMGLEVGDSVPREWALVPANLRALEEEFEERWTDD